MRGRAEGKGSGASSSAPVSEDGGEVAAEEGMLMMAEADGEREDGVGAARLDILCGLIRVKARSGGLDVETVPGVLVRGHGVHRCGDESCGEWSLGSISV